MLYTISSQQGVRFLLKRSFLSYQRHASFKNFRKHYSMLTQSYDHGSLSNEKLLSKTIGNLLDEATERFPDKEAVIFHNDKRRKTYSQLNQKADDLAAGLLALNLKQGDRVGIWGQNHMEWILVFLACAKAGLILVNVNPAYKSKELQFALNKVGMKALFMMPKFKTSDYYEILNEVIPEVNSSQAGDLSSKNVPSLSYVVMTEGPAKQGTFAFDDLITMGGFQEKQMVFSLKKKIQFDSAVNIQFTSGTTGFPKGVTLTHHNLVNNAFIIGHNLNTERVCIPVPLYHCFGMVLGSLACISHGKTQIYPARGFDTKSTLEAIHTERCTAIYGTPVMFIDMLNHPEFDKFNYSSLRTGIMAGSPCPVEIMNQVVEKMNCSEMTIVYGLTETSPATNMTTRDTPIDIRVSTIGQVIPHMEVKVIDESGEVVPVGVKGELCFRGHCVMQGYWGEIEKTREVIDQNNWFHTGDLGVMDENGFCKIIGRLKDMIIRGGVNIYPIEVEQFLYTHTDIEDVQVVSVPDYRMGEEVAAVIRLKTGSKVSAEEIKAFCKGKISHYKIPRYFHFVSEYPMTVTGKIKKNELRKSMAKLLNEGRL